MPKETVGIVLPANTRGGPQKVSAIAALDLAAEGYKVILFLPVLPYYFYFMVLNKRPKQWLKTIIPFVKAWLIDRQFCFHDMLDESLNGQNVEVNFVLRVPSKRTLKKIDYLLIHSVAQTHEFKHKFAQDRIIYLLHHPEEHAHGNTQIIETMREEFKGKILVISPFTAREIGHQLTSPPVVPNPVSFNIWSQRMDLDVKKPRKDVLFFWKGYSYGKGDEIANKLLTLRPNTTMTVWCRNRSQIEAVKSIIPDGVIVNNLSEYALCQLYLDHSLLLFPSTYEGFGMPPIEALSCGCIPVLDPNVGAADLYAVDGINSLHIDASADIVANKMASALDNNDHLIAMRNSAPLAIRDFNPNGYGTRILKAAGFI